MCAPTADDQRAIRALLARQRAGAAAVHVTTEEPCFSRYCLVNCVTGCANELRYAGSRLPAPVARLLRWADGIGGISASQLPGGLLGFAGAALFLAALVLLFTTGLGRGLPGVLSGQDLADARADIGDPQPFPITNA